MAASKYTHKKPLNTVSVILLDEQDNILTLQNGGDPRRSCIGGWITRDYDGPHTVEQAMDAAYTKIAQETNNGDTPEDVQEFYRTHSIQILDSFSYDRREFAHLVVVARWIPGETPLIGAHKAEGRYLTHRHEWWSGHVFEKANNVKGCTKHDIHLFIKRGGVPLF